MLLKQKLRKVEIKTKEGWIKTEFKKIKKGDVFRLFDPPLKPVRDNKGRTKWIALENAFLNERNVWMVKVE